MTPARARLALVLLACFAPALARAGAATVPTDFTDELKASALDLPVGLAEIPDPRGPVRRVLFVEQYGARVRLLVNGTVTTVGSVPGVSTNGSERGLLGIAVDPGWPARPYLYTQSTDNRLGNKVAISRFTCTGDLAFTGTGQIAFDPVTRFDLRADFPDNAANHNGGTLRFGRDGKLYSSLGDDAMGCPALNLTVAAGKILRLDVSRLPASGTGPAPYALIAPTDNPFAANTDSIARLVYAEGLRNPFRFHTDPAADRLLIGDVGETEWEEVDVQSAGGWDFEWPLDEGPAAYTSCPGTPQAPRVDPVAWYSHGEGNAIIGGPIYRSAVNGPGFGSGYDGDAFYSDYYTGFLRRIGWNGSAWVSEPAPGQPDANDWATGLEHASDFLEVSDGALWYCRQYTSGNASGEIRRIAYTGTSGVPPAPVTALVLDAPRPNPSASGVTIGWAQPRAASATVTIHALDGRRVRTLLDGDSPAGPHQLVWDGADDAGRRARAGMYFVRLETAGEVRRSRLARLE